MVLDLSLTPPKGTEPRDFPEYAGLLTALVESGLADLEDTVPRVVGSTVSPAFASLPSSRVETWTGQLSLSIEGRFLEMGLQVCDAERRCKALSALGTKEAASEPVARLLEDASTVLGRGVAAKTSTSWSSPQSSDPYAVLLCGRAAATWYGLFSAPRPEWVGDRRKDPIERAIFIDPQMPIAQWIAGRRQLEMKQPMLAHGSFLRASGARPGTALFLADAARALAIAGESESALDFWERVLARSPKDPRFTLALAEVLLAEANPGRALETLKGLDARYQNDSHVIELRVAIDDARGEVADREDLLILWQDVAKSDPEPVRRRIARRIRARKFKEALDLTPELAARGAQPEASRLTVALGLAVRDWDRVEREMTSLGMTDSLRRLRARVALEKDPSLSPPDLASASDPVAILARGGALLAQNRPEAALADADRALLAEPWIPEGLALRYEALRLLGRTREASSALEILRAADPAWWEVSATTLPMRNEMAGQTGETGEIGKTDQGPSTDPGSTVTGTQAHVAPP